MILQQPFAIPPLSAGAYVRSLTIDHTQVPSTQSNFPVLVSFTDATFKTIANGGHVFDTNCFTFSSDTGGGSLLKWEVERYNGSTGEIVAWVKIASISSSSDTVFYLRYGTSITTDQSDAVNVWTNAFRNVYHLKDGTTLSVADSVGNSNGTNNSATAATGQIDGCAGFASASNQYINSNSTNSNNSVTFSAWVKATSFPSAYNSVIYRNTSNSDASGILVKSNGKLALVLVATTQFFRDGTGSATLSTGTWYLLHMTYDSTNGLKSYVNGTLDDSAAANGGYNSGAIANHIGHDNVNGRYWNGSIDEVRYILGAGSAGSRSADWITVEYANQKSSQTLVTLGSET